jgi:hypothetical protein
MAKPTIIVRIAFSSDPFDATPSWSDVSSDVLEIHTRRGRQHELGRIEAGTATIVLENSSGDYWPYNAGGSYYPNVLPGKRVNIRATYGVTTYDLYTGFVEAWQPSWLSREGGNVPIITIKCADLTKNLSRLLLNSAGFAQELSGTRVGNVLDALGWPAGARDIDAGQSNMIATGALENENAQDHLFTVQESELGIVFIAGDGDVQFQDRHARLKAPYTTSQATFGDDAGEQKYRDIEPSYDDQYIYNDVRVTREGGTEQTASDATSQTSYGKRSLSKTGLLITVDTEAKDQADFLLSRYKDATLRSRTLTVFPDRDPANLYPKILDYDLSTRITVRLNQASIDHEYHIEHISHDFIARQGSWKTEYQLSDADMQAYWLIGVAGYSEIGETTRVGY